MTVPQGNYYSTHPMYNIGNNTMGGPQGSASHMSSPLFDSGASNTLPFWATLDISNLYKITNGPIYHNLLWPPIPHKVPTNILKFERQQGEDAGMHITTYHLW